MKRRLTLTLTAVLGLALAATSRIEAQAVGAVSGLTVVDANGKQVGAVADYSVPAVNLRVSGNSLLGDSFVPRIRVSKSGFLFTGALYFESVDCSGKPYLAADPFPADGPRSLLLNASASIVGWIT
jgi:hypothetical protein